QRTTNLVCECCFNYCTPDVVRKYCY
nr:molluscan insulin-related peptide II A chain, MIP II [Lymnaea stagnalis=freshwater snails, median lip nerves, Peptide Partial, 25 aa] [Lymnaea stagnalis]